MGILPEAMLNYLARLGWAHGDDEFFTMEQFIEWFDLKDVSPSPSRMDLKKLYWINGEHIKITPNEKLAELVKPRLALRDIYDTAKPALEDVLALVKDRAQDLNTLADECLYFYVKQTPAEADLQKHWDDKPPPVCCASPNASKGWKTGTPKPSTTCSNPSVTKKASKWANSACPCASPSAARRKRPASMPCWH